MFITQISKSYIRDAVITCLTTCSVLNYHFILNLALNLGYLCRVSRLGTAPTERVNQTANKRASIIKYLVYR